MLQPFLSVQPSCVWYKSSWNIKFFLPPAVRRPDCCLGHIPLIWGERGKKKKTTTQKRTGGHKTCGWRSMSVCTILFPLVLYRITHNLHWSTCSQSPLMYSWFLLFIFHPLSANITSIVLLGQGQAGALSNVLVINMLTACFIGFSLMIPVAFFFFNQKRNRFSLCLAAPHFLLCPWLLQLASPPLSFFLCCGHPAALCVSTAI